MRVDVFALLTLTAIGLPSRSHAHDPTPKPASLVLKNGKIATLDPAHPKAEALAARGQRIVAIGSNAEVRRFIGPKTTVIDLKGKPAYPGFIEGHGHFLSLGRSLMSLDLKAAKNWSEIVTVVQKAVHKAKPGEWIIGRGWHQEKWARPPKGHVNGYPPHHALSRISPNNPVLLTHATGHASFANAKAMQLAGITKQSKPPKGGEILRDSTGEPIGVFLETAQAAVRSAYNRALASRSRKQRRADDLRAVQLATRECLAKGITSFQDAGSSLAAVRLFKRLADEGKLHVRLWVMLRVSNAELRKNMAAVRTIGYGSGYLTVRAVKRMADGALGSHGALLLKPYNDLPSSHGLRVESLESIREAALLCAKNDYQLCVHAIGDRANREVLDLFRDTFRSFPKKNDWRWRIEHAQHLHPADIPRFAELKVIASMQANHCTSDGPFVVKRLGRRRAEAGAYAWRSLLDAGATVINGTDAPVEDVNPLQSYHASITRRMKNGDRFFAKQCMTPMEALKSYTTAAAYAAFEEKVKGTLSVGKLADVVVLSRRILTTRPASIPTTRVLYTIVGGEIRYRASSKTQ